MASGLLLPVSWGMVREDVDLVGMKLTEDELHRYLGAVNKLCPAGVYVRGSYNMETDRTLISMSGPERTIRRYTAGAANLGILAGLLIDLMKHVGVDTGATSAAKGDFSDMGIAIAEMKYGNA